MGAVMKENQKLLEQLEQTKIRLEEQEDFV